MLEIKAAGGDVDMRHCACKMLLALGKILLLLGRRPNAAFVAVLPQTHNKQPFWYNIPNMRLTHKQQRTIMLQ